MKLLRSYFSRSTLFAAFFSYTAYHLAGHGLLTSQYVAVITALHVTVVGRAIADDYHQRALSAATSAGEPNANG